MDDTVMVEACLKTNDSDEQKAIFKAFCDDPSALEPAIHADDAKSRRGFDWIVCGFKNKHVRQRFIGKIDQMFPGKIDWR